MTTPGKKFRQALKDEQPLQVVGVINAYVAMMAEKIGFKALYLSGAGVANASYGLPDIGLTTLDNVVEDVRRITDAIDLPLLVDIDTGWGNERMIARAIKAVEKAGAAGIHIEDQNADKRCGHLPDKRLVSTEDMCLRIKACLSAKKDPHFVIMARTDAFANEGLEGALKRLQAYKQAGADMLFPEALDSLQAYQTIKNIIGLPLLANITEFGKTPLFTREELQKAGIDIALYPLSANRAMNLAALKVFAAIRDQGTQKELLEEMQTRDELYHFLNYQLM